MPVAKAFPDKFQTVGNIPAKALYAPASNSTPQNVRDEVVTCKGRTFMPTDTEKLAQAVAYLEVARVMLHSALVARPIDTGTMLYMNDLMAVVKGDARGDRFECARTLADICESIIEQLPASIEENPALFASELYGYVDERLPLLGTHMSINVVDRLDEVTEMNRAREALVAAHPDIDHSTSFNQYDGAAMNYAYACYHVGLRHGAIYEHIHRVVREGGKADTQ